jgi:hypothetical protein
MQKPHDDSKACLTAFVQDSTLTVVIEMSLASWLVAGMIPGVKREPQKENWSQSGGAAAAFIPLARRSHQGREGDHPDCGRV